MIPRVKLLNSDTEGMALAIVEGADVATWAKDEHGTIGGSRWEADGSDFAYALIDCRSGIATELRAEGYEVDDSDFVDE